MIFTLETCHLGSSSKGHIAIALGTISNVLDAICHEDLESLFFVIDVTKKDLTVSPKVLCVNYIRFLFLDETGDFRLKGGCYQLKTGHGHVLQRCYAGL